MFLPLRFEALPMVVVVSLFCVDAYWEHQQLQRQISEQTKKAQLYAGFDMNATFDRFVLWVIGIIAIDNGGGIYG
jgi:hypothetical protein